LQFFDFLGLMVLSIEVSAGEDKLFAQFLANPLFLSSRFSDFFSKSGTLVAWLQLIDWGWK